jgi:hypothetical protein
MTERTEASTVRQPILVRARPLTGTPIDRSDMYIALEPSLHPTTTSRPGAPTATPRRWRRARDVVATKSAAALTWDDSRPGTAGFARWTAAVGHRIDECGLAAVTRELDHCVAVARRTGVAPVAADVLADPTQPEPARQRAFAHVVSALVSADARSTSGRCS